MMQIIDAFEIKKQESFQVLVIMDNYLRYLVCRRQYVEDIETKWNITRVRGEYVRFVKKYQYNVLLFSKSRRNV